MDCEHWEKYWSDPANSAYWQKPSRDVLDFIKVLSPKDYPKVLDLGCGLGRHAVAFATAGFEVAATDASQEGLTRTCQWAAELGLPIDARLADMCSQPFAAGSFDVVVSYNVIYHGLRQRFAAAIVGVHSLLRCGGLFWFTCPSRRDGKYGSGPMVAPHTYAAANSITPGDIHYFADESDLRDLLSAFEISSLRCEEGIWNNRGQDQFFSNWQVLAKKP